MIIHSNYNANNLLIRYHHFIRRSTILAIRKEVYGIIIFKVVNKISSDFSPDELFKDEIPNWEQIYSMPNIATYNTDIRSILV